MAKKKEAYLSLSAMLRAREPRLLSGDRAGRMLDAASFEEAAKLLTDCGYPDLSQAGAAQIEEALTLRRSQTLDELEKLCPERAIVRAEGENGKGTYAAVPGCSESWRGDPTQG